MDLVSVYQAFLKENAKDEKTIKTYVECVRNYSNWNTDDIANAKPIRVMDYISELRHTKKLAPSTVNKYIAALSSFYDFLIESEVITTSPMRRIRKIAVADSSAQEPKWLEPAQQQRFVDYASLEVNDWMRVRNLAIIDLMLYTGLRLQEVIDLQLDDVITMERDLKIIVRDGKRGKYAELMLINKNTHNIKKWLVERKKSEKAFHTSSYFLFVSERSGKLSARSIQKFMAKYSKLSGVSGVTPHRLRHTFCKNLARRDIPIEVIRRLARHENIATTAIYINPDSKELIAALRKI